ncbi:MAG: AAA family ATPase [Flavobacterium sp.]|uniref:AAA family ATPase n=1 Tax=Flavobacterium sp. TaxID=239 RepID=UPI0022C23423|nr:AAA family ATPase [Flavobacterium sp.]MCZ8197692.1 AAA family ATPase [Flavobacterium sp.]
MYLHFSNNGNLPKELIESKYHLNLSENDVNIETKNGNFFLKIELINFLVGSNNSGKSRFLRSLLKINKGPNNIQLLENNSKIDKYFDEIKTLDWYRDYGFCINNRLISDISLFHNQIETFRNRVSRNELTVENLFLNESLFNDSLNGFSKLHEELRNSRHINRTEIKNTLTIVEKILEAKKKVDYFKVNSVKDCFYISTLRSSIKSEIYDETVFERTIKKLYDLDKEKIYTGQNLYTEVLKVRNSLKDKRKGFEKFEKFLERNFFNNQTVEIIADLEQKQLVFFVNGDERKIQDIGDGIQQIILLLFPIYTSDENTWILIEEPETHLHPGLQKLFIETLINDEYLRAKNLKYFFTTHSNHFLDLSIDSKEISILQFEKINNEIFSIKETRHSKETLDLLGVNNSSVFLANSSIWVEGPTDRKYISTFLKLYCKNKSKHLRENIDFAFLEYGGNLIAHYLFEEDFDSNSLELVKDKIYSFSISNKIYLLADNDNVDNRSKKGKRRKELEELSNNNTFKYQNTIYKEIENLLPFKILIDFIKTLVNASEIEKIEHLTFKRAEYVKIGLGEFILQLLKDNNINCTKKIKSSTGETLSTQYKHQLCDLVVNGNYTYEDLIFENKQLDDIVVNLYNFIKPK